MVLQSKLDRILLLILRPFSVIAVKCAAVGLDLLEGQLTNAQVSEGSLSFRIVSEKQSFDFLFLFNDFVAQYVQFDSTVMSEISRFLEIPDFC